jgi:hypothetical protein
MSEALIQHLVDSGIGGEKAQEIAASFPAEGTEETFDKDALTKALVELRETFANGEEDDSEEVQSDFELEADDGIVADQSGTIAAIAKGADAILEETRHHNQVISKALILMGERVASLENHLSTDRGHIAKSLDAVADNLAEPNPVKAQIDQSGVIPAPGDATDGVPTRFSLISKALDEMRTSTDSNRAQTLGRAVSLLESGADPSFIADSYKLVSN